MSTAGAAGRIASMDQFRGYTVAGMFVVNFLGGLEAVHRVFKHNNTYFSYADTIMPSFLFAAGFSYRMTVLRRLPQLGPARTYRRVVARSAGLVLLSLVLFGFGAELKAWDTMTADNVREFVAGLLKANLWEILAIIGVVQVLTLPVVAARPGVRVATVAAFLAAHAALSYVFNYDFVYGRPNWLDAYWGAAQAHPWDGGFFGLLTWSVPLLGGTLAYDVVAAGGGGAGSARRLVGWGVALMALGYLLSCLTTLYDVGPSPQADPDGAAVSPVLPPLERLGGRLPASLLADPPFVAPPPPEARRPNYWMMDKRVVTVTFALFATGYSLALYGLFVLACDVGGWGLGLFRMLGQNPLAAYVIHHAVEKAVRALVPADSPLWWDLVGLAAFFAVSVLFVRYLDLRGYYLRL